MASQLDYIMLNCLFYANRKIFSELIKELNELRNEGLLMKVNNSLKKVYFQIALLNGDNLVESNSWFNRQFHAW